MRFVPHSPGVTMEIGPYIAVSGEVWFRNVTQQQFDELAGEFCRVWDLDVEVEP